MTLEELQKLDHDIAVRNVIVSPDIARLVRWALANYHKLLTA